MRSMAFRIATTRPLDFSFEQPENSRVVRYQIAGQGMPVNP